MKKNSLATFVFVILLASVWIAAEEKLKTGSQYAWYVQAVDTSGNALGS